MHYCNFWGNYWGAFWIRRTILGTLKPFGENRCFYQRNIFRDPETSKLGTSVMFWPEGTFFNNAENLLRKLKTFLLSLFFFFQQRRLRNPDKFCIKYRFQAFFFLSFFYQNHIFRNTNKCWGNIGHVFLVFFAQVLQSRRIPQNCVKILDIFYPRNLPGTDFQEIRHFRHVFFFCFFFYHKSLFRNVENLSEK